MALSVASPSYLAPHIKQYKERVRHAKPVGKFINDQWLSSTMAICDWDDKGARELAAKSLRNVLRAGSSVSQGSDASLRAARRLVGRRAGASEGELLPLPQDGGRRRGRAGSRPLRRIRADRVRAVEPDRRRHARRARRAGGRRPESCLQGIAIHEEAGVDELQFLMATGDGAPRQGDDVDRALRQARHPGAEEEEGVIKARPEVEAMTPYVAPLEGRRSLLRLDFNESTIGPSPAVVDAIRRLPPGCLRNLSRIRRAQRSVCLGDRRAGEPRRGLQRRRRRDPRDLRRLRRAGQHLADHRADLRLLRALRAAAGNDDRRGPVSKRLELPARGGRPAARGAPAALLHLQSEQSHGTLLAPSAIVALARSAPATLVVVDELYVAFTGQTVVPAALELPNVVTLAVAVEGCGHRGTAAGLRDRSSEHRRATPSGDGAVRHQHVRGGRREGRTGR